MCLSYKVLWGTEREKAAPDLEAIVTSVLERLQTKNESEDLEKGHHAI